MIPFLAQEEVPFTDTSWTDQYRIPFGDWVKQIVFWTNENLDPVLRVIEWPFKTVLGIFVLGDATIKTIPWVWVVALMFLIASMVRNVRVGFMVAVSLSMCALLGPDYWVETAHTIGLVFVAVLFCAIIGIPLGVLCGRVDGVWSVVRPTLDAMQVVHSFVYMLPVIFFWGIGNIPAVMVMMVFAFPPLVRLTNLGIRQVPEDVVEASRSYGASELRVLRDVQLPLARPAIMTGLNQTLLLSISMLGIAAIMAAGGLGKLIFKAINSQDPAAASSAGLAFFLVAVVLDRISQREADDGLSMVDRYRRAWAYRSKPEEMLAAEAKSGKSSGETESSGAPAPVSQNERLALIVAAVGGAVVAVGTLLPWGADSSLITGRSRESDLDLAGQVFSGLSATGGSWFGIVAILVALVGTAWALRPILPVPESVSIALAKGQSLLLVVFLGLTLLVWVTYMIGFDLTGGPIDNWALWVFVGVLALVPLEAYARGTARAGADGVAILGVTALALVSGYALISPSTVNVQVYHRQFGLYVSLIGAILMAGGGLAATRFAPYSSVVPIPPKLALGRIVAAGFVAALVVGGAVSAWTFDTRVSTVETPELKAEIEALKAEATADPSRAPEISSLILSKKAEANKTKRVLTSGLDREGSGLGVVTIVWGAIGVLALVAGSGIIGHDERKRWRIAALAAGVGAAIAGISVAWVMSLVRASDTNFVSGAGNLLTLAGGFVLFRTAMSVVELYERERIFLTTTPVSENPVLIGVGAATSPDQTIDQIDLK